MKSLIKSHIKTSAVHKPQSDVKRDLLTVKEVARILRVDDTTVRHWIRQGVLEAVVLPQVSERQAYRIRRETLKRVLEG